jgi:signal transduction histidine kinase
VVPLISRSGSESWLPRAAVTGPESLLLHDLGQPLAAIRALAGTPLPADGGPAASEAADRLRRIAELAELMNALVGSAGSEPDPAPEARADVAAVVLDAVVSAAPAFAGRLRCRARDQAAVPVDPLDLRRAVGNLVDNAARAAGPGGHVEVGVRRDSDRVKIEVADDGPGFGLVPQRTGKGLTVALDVASACGGTLEIQDGPDGGALVRLELPIAASDACA